MNRRRWTSTYQSQLTVGEAAAHWIVRMDAADLDSPDREAFQHWLDESAAHREEFARTRAMWDRWEGAGGTAELQVLRAAALAIQPRRPWLRVAAAAAVTALLLVVAPNGINVRSGPLERAAATRTGIDGAPAEVAGLESAEYATGRNERSTVTLSDGTAVSLNLNTTLDISFTGAERRVRLARGQAFFEVAKEVSRPFVVQAADRRIVALGTQFDVRLDPDRVEVVLLEGKIAVDRQSKSILESLSGHKSHVELLPNQRLVAALGEAVAVTATDAELATTWRQGWIVFQDESLVTAVAELNRYAEHPIVIGAASVGALRVSGVFRTGQPGRFGAILQELLPLRAVTDDKRQTLLLSSVEDGSQLP